MDEPDLYAILRVPPTASQEDIRRAYRALLREHHPDLHKQQDAVSARRQARIMAAILHAYKVLSDPERRAAYDRNRRQADYRDQAGQAPAQPAGQWIGVRVHRDRDRAGGDAGAGYRDDAVWLFPNESPLRPPPDVFERVFRWFFR
ncbi:DnaJ domain-containing protein [Arthrobacter crystallopoietes BAB-32]|uniref:DnaJ domain-containing protein n=1 Tax=Arthrobacter crystallopoietes BAB-32 TaxID=1246476 RepID=N1UY16_9MICC|nr:DnaJ domain-containing protein [Arthrobacter crystallopoietes]EMY32674.1 DnaJ domain-containing protein [Arthrobacter crystallopoietes BAB-32]